MTDYLLSIVVPVFNKINYTLSCLKDLSQLDQKTHQIIIVDDASTDNTQEKVLQQLSLISNLNYHKSFINGGFAKSCNLGYNLSLANNVLFLNNDIKVRNNEHSWTDKIIYSCQNNLNTLFSPTMGELDKDFNFIREANQQLNNKYSYLSGWCLAGSKNTFDQLRVNNNLFDQDFFAYFEDTSLSFLAKQKNIKLEYLNLNNDIVHFGKVSTKQLNTHQLYKTSREIFIKKWKNKI